MYYPECENCANEYPELKNTIEKIDDLIHSLPPSSVLRVNDVSQILSEKDSKISGVFQILVQEGLISKDQYYECPFCENLIDIPEYLKAKDEEESYECTQCQHVLTNRNLEEIIGYRINAPKIRNSKKLDNNISDQKFTSSKGFTMSLPSDIVTDPFCHTPLLRYYSKDSDFLNSKPFENKRVFIVLHLLRDLIPFVQGLKEYGLDMNNAYFFYKDYPYPQKDSIKNWLEEQGATVQPRSLIPQYLNQLDNSDPEKIGDIVIIEDGGFIVPKIHSEYKNLIPHVIGAVEQTTRGIRNDESVGELQFPVLSVATSEVKGTYEPQYIGKAVIENLKKMLPNISINGKNVGLLGCGTIGKEIAKWFKENNAIVKIYDLSPTNQLWIKENGYQIVETACDAVRDSRFIIGASGNRSVSSKEISCFSHNSYVISASSELYEIDSEEIARRSSTKSDLVNSDEEIIGTKFVLPPHNTEINLLANGYPINFWGFNSMPDEASDLIMTIIFICACEVAKRTNLPKGINSDEVNSFTNKYRIVEKFLEIHKSN